MTRNLRRSLRLPIFAAFAIALAAPALSHAAEEAENTPAIATQTTLAAESHDHAGRTKATISVSVLGEDRLPAQGAIVITDNGRPLAGAALTAQGKATLTLDLPAGEHAFSANYSGDSAHQASVSRPEHVRAEAATVPDFQITVAPATLALTAGATGTIIASITPENSSSLTAPMFLTLSCSGLPDESSCNFTPVNVEILPNATKPITSSMIVLTQQASSTASVNKTSPLTLAILLPGALGLGGLAWSLRSRPWLQRLSLMAIVGFVALLGMTACNSRYDYYHHGPPVNPATPSGTYTIEVTAQSSDGVSATTHTTDFALTVK